MRFLDAVSTKKYWGDKLDYTIDPRPDLKEDSELWTTLLSKVDDIEVLQTLHAVRGGGTKLVKHGTRYKLEPFYSKFLGWETEEDWNWFRERFLVPHKEKIQRVLKTLEEP